MEMMMIDVCSKCGMRGCPGASRFGGTCRQEAPCRNEATRPLTADEYISAVRLVKESIETSVRAWAKKWGALYPDEALLELRRLVGDEREDRSLEAQSEGEIERKAEAAVYREVMREMGHYLDTLASRLQETSGAGLVSDHVSESPGKTTTPARGPEEAGTLGRPEATRGDAEAFGLGARVYLRGSFRQKGTVVAVNEQGPDVDLVKVLWDAPCEPAHFVFNRHADLEPAEPCRSEAMVTHYGTGRAAAKGGGGT